MKLERFVKAKVIAGLKKKLQKLKGPKRNNLVMLIQYLESSPNIKPFKK